MLGDALLAAPRVPSRGAAARSVYLPAGRWFDWWTGAAHGGPVDVEVDAPLERLPLFGRAGTIVPTATVDGTGTVEDSTITFRVFPGDGEGSIYDDDGETFDYRDGAFAHRRYEVTSDGDGVEFRSLDGRRATSRRPAQSSSSHRSATRRRSWIPADPSESRCRLDGGRVAPVLRCSSW